MKKTTLGYLEHDGRYLMMLRNKKDKDQSEGKWLGVGGKFLPGEDANECFAREVFEETGFTLESVHFHGVVHFISDTWEDEDMYLFTSDNFSWKIDDCQNLGLSDACRNSEDSYNAQTKGPLNDSQDTEDLSCPQIQEASDGCHKRAFSRETEPPLPQCNEGTLYWIPKDEVLSLNLWEGDHLFLEKLIANEDFGELTVRYQGDTLVSFE